MYVFLSAEIYLEFIHKKQNCFVQFINRSLDKDNMDRILSYNIERRRGHTMEQFIKMISESVNYHRKVLKNL